MDPADFAALVSALQEEHDIDEDSATELARAVTGALTSVFKKAGSVLSTKGMDPEEAPRVLTADHLRFALQPYTATLGPLSNLPSRIVADGDGNCLLTTLALDMELKRGVALARTCLEEDRKPTPDEGVPYLDGSAGETAWLDGVELRKTFARFYGPDRIHRLLPESFGNVTWQEKVRNEDGSEATVTKERRMTRCDMICTEVQTMRHTMEIDFSPCDAALAKRLAIASSYVQDISKHGVWCSAPSIVAFSIARLEKRPVRVYYCSGSSLYVYADTVPDGALPPPPAHLDEFLLDFEDSSTSKKLAEDDDLHAFVPTGLASPMDMSSPAGGGGAAAGADDEEEDEEDDPDPDSYTQDVTRILFNGGHYDLAVTASERLALLRVFPDLGAHFQRFPSSLKPSSGGKK